MKYRLFQDDRLLNSKIFDNPVYGISQNYPIRVMEGTVKAVTIRRCQGITVI
jgi:hypothetical protein